MSKKFNFGSKRPQLCYSLPQGTRLLKHPQLSGVALCICIAERINAPLASSKAACYGLGIKSRLRNETLAQNAKLCVCKAAKLLCRDRVMLPFGKHLHRYAAQRLSGARYIVLLQRAYAHGSATISQRKSIAERFYNRY